MKSLLPTQPETRAAMFSKIYPIFHETYPNILFRIREECVKKMEQLVLQNEVHFAFMTYVEGFKNPDLEYMDMDSEYMVLGLPVTLPAGAPGRKGQPRKTAAP
ncbi:MAG: hypothetical protein ACLUD2_09055 [Clostridium sp.]